MTSQSSQSQSSQSQSKPKSETIPPSSGPRFTPQPYVWVLASASDASVLKLFQQLADGLFVQQQCVPGPAGRSLGLAECVYKVAARVVGDVVGLDQFTKLAEQNGVNVTILSRSEALKTLGFRRHQLSERVIDV